MLNKYETCTRIELSFQNSPGAEATALNLITEQMPTRAVWNTKWKRQCCLRCKIYLFYHTQCAWARFTSSGECDIKKENVWKMTRKNLLCMKNRKHVSFQFPNIRCRNPKNESTHFPMLASSSDKIQHHRFALNSTSSNFPTFTNFVGSSSWWYFVDLCGSQLSYFIISVFLRNFLSERFFLCSVRVF